LCKLSHPGSLPDIGAVDTDGDGSADAQEIANMTDPLDPASPFRMLSFGPAIGFDPSTFPAVELSITTFPGLSYRLQTGSTLSEFTDIPGSRYTAIGLTENLNVTRGAKGDFIRARRD
jgi:hypothetical protein